MTCAAIEPRLPLYVGGDLPPREANEVRAHVAACERCAGMLESYRETQVWLKSARVPELGGEVFDRLRRSVRQQISDSPPRPFVLAWASRLLESLRGAWFQPVALAAAGVALVLGFGSFSLLRERSLRERALPANAPAELGAAGVPPKTLKSGAAPMAATAAAQGRAALAGDDAAAGGELLARAPDPIGNDEADLEPAGGRLRIELKTQDPTVRIIWFGSRGDDTAGGGRAQN